MNLSNYIWPFLLALNTMIFSSNHSIECAISTRNWSFTAFKCYQSNILYYTQQSWLGKTRWQTKRDHLKTYWITKDLIYSESSKLKFTTATGLEPTTTSTFVAVWLSGWMFVYQLSGCGFESSWLKLQISRLLRASSSLTFRQL